MYGAMNFLQRLTLVCLSVAVACFPTPLLQAEEEAGIHFAAGVKVGEVTQDSAIIWARLTREAQPRFDLLPIMTEGAAEEQPQISMPEETVPGVAGELRVRYGLEGEEMTTASPWRAVNAEGDFIAQIPLEDLQPGSAYEFVVEARKSGSDQIENHIKGSFHTAFAADSTETVRFIVTTCQAVRSIDAGKDGHVVYSHMLDWKPHFFVHTGDILYYDKAPFVKNEAQARAKWSLMFGYGHNRNFHRHVSSYFMKDDHDTLKNDCWPGQTYGDLTFARGLEIFREQVPMGEKTHRTIRWGKNVQVWLTENRDFRSPNRMEDGPQKTILGEEQKAWLKKSMTESDATYKFLITPGPIVGPDKGGKNDNHSNKGFAHEGGELRNFLAGLENTYVITGDRHWQYCSQDPETGLIEFGCGPINTRHNYGGAPGKKPMHRYFGARGGFFGITVENGKARAEWFALDDPETEGPLMRAHMEEL